MIRAAQAEATAGARRPGRQIPAQRRRQAAVGRRGAEYGAPGHFPRTRRRDDRRRRRALALPGRPDRKMSPTTKGLRRGPRGGRCVERRHRRNAHRRQGDGLGAHNHARARRITIIFTQYTYCCCSPLSASASSRFTRTDADTAGLNFCMSTWPNGAIRWKIFNARDGQSTSFAPLVLARRSAAPTASRAIAGHVAMTASARAPSERGSTAEAEGGATSSRRARLLPFLPRTAHSPTATPSP